MTFSLSYELASDLFTRERIPAIRFFRDAMQDAGCLPDLRTCRDIVDRVRSGQVEIMDWSRGEKSILVKLER